MMNLRAWLLGFSFFATLSLSPTTVAHEGLPLGLVDNATQTETSVPRTLGLTLDRYYTPAVGSELVLSLLHGVQTLEDRVLQQTQGDTRLQPVLARIGQFAIEGLLWNTATTAQHEIFGHGFRARECHMPAHYRVNIGGGGRVRFPVATYNQLSYHEKAAFNAGGMEATSRLAKDLRDQWLNHTHMDMREAHVYLNASLDQTLYMRDAFKKDKNAIANGHDVGNYVAEVNTWHGATVLTNDKLKNRALLDLLDPYLFYSVYGVGHYLYDGTQSFEYPMINLGDYQYLPALRVIPAPYGIEYQWMNFVKGPDYDIQAGLRAGKTGTLGSHALDLEINRIFSSDLLFMDLKSSLWHQPKLFTASAATTKGHMGAALSIIARYRMTQSVELSGQAGYKTTGYMPGEILKHTPILRVGFKAFL